MRTYEKYKDSGISWIGKVPEDWERVRIKYGLSQSIAGVWGDEKKGDENDVVCYRMADFNYDKGILNLDNVTYRNILPQQLVGRMVKKGDLILEKSGGGDLYPVGRVVRVNSDQKATCSNFAHTIATNDNISSNFLYYYFFNLYSKGVSRLFFNQTTGIQNLKVGEYLSQDMYAPSKPEQEAIAYYLDKKTAEIDKIIAEREKKIELLNELKSSIISRAVTKGINPHAKMKDSGIDWIGEIPEDWKVGRFKYSFKVRKGLTITKADLVDEGIPVISYGQVHSKDNPGTSLKESLLRYVPNKYLYSDKDSLVCKGDFIFADTSEDIEGCGNCVYVDRNMELFAGYHSIIAKSIHSDDCT